MLERARTETEPRVQHKNYRLSGDGDLTYVSCKNGFFFDEENCPDCGEKP